MTTSGCQPYRLIVIDDTASIHEDFRKTLCGRSAEDLDAAANLARQEAALFGEAAQTESAASYEIDSAMQGESGKEMVGRALAEGRPYAVAFVDMRMPPGWDGLKTIEELWKADPGLQVVICTAYSDHSWKQIIERLGISDKLLILKKPFDNVEVNQLAMALCEKWAMTRAARLKLDDLEAQVEKRTAQLHHAATHDRLTGLANREHLVHQLRQVIALADPAGYALLCLDFDRFKLVNDTLGHDMGDLLLQMIADRLRQGLRDDERILAARMGGDEFIVLLDRLADPDESRAIAQRLLDVLRKPYDLQGHPVTSTASIGITTSQMNYSQPQDVLRHADMAMYRAKAAGRDRCVLFDRSMHDEIVSRMEMEQLLRRAVERQEFYAFYQPIVRLGDGKVAAMEAFCRLKRDNGEAVAPGDFIPIAEEIGLIGAIGELMLRESLRQVRRWQQMDPQLHDLTVCVNVSRHQLFDAAIVPRVADLLQETAIRPDRLLLEITEATITSSSGVFVERLRQLKDLGVRFALDDFGTGQSSLTGLHRFPVDELKIDRSFIKSVTDNKEYAAIIQAIVTLAANLGMRVTAEGIETESQLALVQALDCHAAQGYYLAQPREASYWDRHLSAFNRGVAPPRADAA